MIVRLLHREREVDLGRALPWNAAALRQDLGLEAVCGAMAGEDRLVLEVCRHELLAAMENGPEAIAYRQEVLRDSLRQAALVRELYALATEAVESEKKHYLGVLARHPDWVLRLAVEQSEAYLEQLHALGQIAARAAGAFAAPGWTEMFGSLRQELSESFLERLAGQIEELKFRHGMRLGARLGAGNKGEQYMLLGPAPATKPGWRTRLLGERAAATDFTLDPRDESGIRALEELQNRGLVGVANTLARSVAHVHDFFHRLRTELAFYIGCLNLHERLTGKGEAVAMPEAAEEQGRLSFRGLYDVGLALGLEGRAVGNDAEADGKPLIVVTGANQGGKTTFLRSVGLAQIMMQAGMFVGAERFCSSVHDGLFPHFRREEDAGMRSGKLEEELGRMEEIVGRLTPHAMILFNESFASTHEREGAEIARQILTAMLEKRLRMVCVTHLYDLAQWLYRHRSEQTVFLRAERARSFRLAEGAPLATSFGQDIYNRVFGSTP